MSYGLTSNSIYDRVVRHIFYSGQVTPGSKIVERKLANHLGVSHIPIRESLGRLSGQGLLVREPGENGVRVRKYTAEDIRQLFELREVLEGAVARGAARLASEADLARLEQICQQIEAAFADLNPLPWAELDHAFHSALADACHNDRLAMPLKALLTECHYIFFYPQVPGPPTISLALANLVVSEHRGLLRLIVAHEADAAEQMARQDMREAVERILQSTMPIEPATDPNPTLGADG